MFRGEVVGIFISPEAGAEMRSVESVNAVAGRGLEGDRYFEKAGTFTKEVVGSTRECTLVESEAIAALSRDYETEIALGDTRRNIVTSGVPLNHLIGVRFSIGEVTLEGVKLCEPCGHLERLVGQPIKPGLVHRGGLRARIIESGQIKVGDVIEGEEEAA